MELDARKMRILQAIIDDYIMTATPVGSRTIAKRADIGFSPATIRNEMADLEEMGYLDQPHTSAGRVPSDKAYRLYVNSIMQRAKLSEAEVRYIRDHYSRRLDEVDEVVKQTAWVLSSMTKYTSMVLAPQLHAIKLKYIHLVPVAEDKALVIIVTDAGMTRDSIIRIPPGMAPDALERLGRTLTARFANCRLDEITLAQFNELSGEVAQQRAFFDEMLRSVRRSMAKGGRSVELSGATNILNYPEYSDMDRARALLTAIEEKDLLYRVLTEATNVEFSVRIGSENEDESIQDCSVVTATYKIGSNPIGSFGVIGPTRMDYARVLAMLGLIGRSLSDVLTNMFEEERK
jgi:heat-inducible transcription repressor hrcA